MSDIQVSLVASANRVAHWKRFCDSLVETHITYEVIFVGDTPPREPMPSFFRYIQSSVKPSQCYEVSFREAKGEVIHWTADDASYVCPEKGCLNGLERAYNYYKFMESRFENDGKSVVALRPIEDGGDVYRFHRFFGGVEWSPVMAPFALINRKFFVEELGGYDRRFISGQSENDVVMRVMEAGGRVEICMDAYLAVHHRQVHPDRPSDNKFRRFYDWDRKILEECWVREGYGAYVNKHNCRNVTISGKRLSPVERFENKDLTTITQGPKGIWE